MKYYNFPYIWIERNYKSICSQYSATASGIRVTYDKGLDKNLVLQAKALVAYLHKNYYFPVRCNISITNHRRYYSEKDGHIYYGVFYDNVDVCPKRKIYPRIAVAGQVWKHSSIGQIQKNILHELTHYFQWFFAEDENRTDRSLEMEANKWADYILYCYKNQ